MPSILVDAERLYGLLLRAELMMNARDRVRYANRAVRLIEDIIEHFVLAYDFEEDRYEHLKKMWGRIAVFIRLMRQVGKVDAIRIQPKYESMTPDQMKLEIVTAIASLDEGATGWKKSVERAEKLRRKEIGNKGTTRADGRNGQTPEE